MSVPSNTDTPSYLGLNSEVAASVSLSLSSIYARATPSRRSCTTCRRRKVKCNKETPCSNCTRNGVTCIFPPPGRARPRPRTERTEAGWSHRDDGELRLDRGNATWSEEVGQYRPQIPSLLTTAPQADTSSTMLLPPSEAQSISAPTTMDRQSQLARIPEPGIEQWAERCLYFGVWPPKSHYQLEQRPAASTKSQRAVASVTRLADLLAEPPVSSPRQDADMAGEEEIETISNTGSVTAVDRVFQSAASRPDGCAFILGYNLIDSSLHDMHPSPSQIPFYWQTFVENVDPLIKIFHIPSTGRMVRDMQRNTQFLSPCKEALMFSIYLAAVTSMTPTEVKQLLNHEKQALIAQYRLATEKALAKAEMITAPNLMTLQAFVLFLNSLRDREHPRYTWTMTALALRMAQGLGLHTIRRGGALSPYDTEISLRLWLSIWLLDLRTALDQGSDFSVPDATSIEGLPINLNDADFDTGSTAYPNSEKGMTDMAPTLIHYELGLLMKKMRQFELDCEREGPHLVSASAWDDMEEAAALCKTKIESTFLRDSTSEDSFQRFTTLNTRLFFAEVPLLMYDSVWLSDFRTTLSARAVDGLLAASIEAISCAHDIVSLSTSSCWGKLFLTHANWHAISIILEELCLHSNKTDIAQKRWGAIEVALACCGSHPWPQTANGLWKSLIELMRKAKRMRDANQSLYLEERKGTGIEVTSLTMPEIWPGSDADSSSAWPTEFPDDNMDAGWPADFGHSPSDLLG